MTDHCVWCGADSYLHVDHVVPRKWGGSDHVKNLRILCRSCNQLAWVIAELLGPDNWALFPPAMWRGPAAWLPKRFPRDYVKVGQSAEKRSV
jgi:HNH endonuclease